MKNFLSILLISLMSVSAAGQTFYDYYSKGQKNQNKQNWSNAILNYQLAIDIKENDEKRVRTYGVNFIEYFPNREMGVVYFELGEHKTARIYLEKSLSTQFSDRAQDYLSKIEDKPEAVSEPAAVIPADRSTPSIKIFAPTQLTSSSFNPVSNDTKQITISGKVEDQSGIFEVLVNGKDASITGSGEFQAEVLLSVGANRISIVATDIHQNSETREYTIVREEMEMAKNELLSEEGKYYALIIGVSEYEDRQITDLDGLPTKDASFLSWILTEKYTFEEEDVLLMKNPTRKEILRVFDGLSNSITREDNLLIFYAGHGFYDEKTELGYWLPADAEADYTANWIYNDVLVANLKRIQSKHTLLVSDACFSGSIFKTRALIKDAPTAFQKKYELTSRKAITSGVLKTVPNKSVFFKYFADRLERNTEVYMSASQLFQSIEIPVANNSPNTPQYGDIQNVGDEGGDFIFIRR